MRTRSPTLTVDWTQPAVPESYLTVFLQASVPLTGEGGIAGSVSGFCMRLAPVLLGHAITCGQCTCFIFATGKELSGILCLENSRGYC